MNDNNLLDIIKEVINIGMGEAANSLSKLVNTRIMINVPDISIVDVADIHEHIPDELSSLGVYMAQGFSGVGQGKTVLSYTKDCSLMLLNTLSGQGIRSSSLTEIEIATLNEIGNILMGSCMAQIADILESNILFDIPEVSVEISEKYFQNLLKTLKGSDKAIVAKNEMHVKDADVQGYFFIFLNFEDFKNVIDRLQKKAKN